MPDPDAQDVVKNTEGADAPSPNEIAAGEKRDEHGILRPIDLASLNPDPNNPTHVEIIPEAERGDSGAVYRPVGTGSAT
jgi:hypothetical protein